MSKRSEIIDTIIYSDKKIFLVNSGAGTGKTTLLNKLTNEVTKQNPKARILFVSFANATIRAGMDIIKNMRNVDFFTIHKLALNVLRDNVGNTIKSKHIKHLGYNKDIDLKEVKPFAKEGDHWKILNNREKVLKEIIKASGYKCKSQSIEAYIDRCFWANQTRKKSNQIYSDVLDEYIRYKQEEQVIDFNDMVGFCLALLKDNAEQSLKMLIPYDYIYLDEAQDTSNNLWEIVHIFHKQMGCKIVLAGDSCQFAYGFMGVENNFFDKVIKENEKEIKVFNLNISKRCSDPICKLSNTITHQINLKYKTKIIPSPKNKVKIIPIVASWLVTGSDINFCVNKILKLKTQKKYLDKDFVVLVREMASVNSKSQIKGLVRLFREKNINYYYRRIKKNDKFKDECVFFVNLYKVAVGQFNLTDLLEVMTLANGIGYLKAQKILKNCNKESLENELLKEANQNKEVFELIKKLSTNFKKNSEIIKHLEIFIKDEGVEIGNSTIKFFKRIKGKNSLINGWEAKLQAKINNKENGVAISTIHSFKGGQAKCVFVIGVSDQEIPHPKAMNLNEELCLLNIAVTRASKRLYMIYEKGLPPRTNLSRFLLSENPKSCYKKIKIPWLRYRGQEGVVIDSN